jgi:hypothetical protein
LQLLTLFYLTRQLDMGVLFWHAQAMATDCEASPAGPEDQARADRLWDVARMAGYRLCVEADAWRRLTAELHVDAEALLRDLRGYDSLTLTERAARLFPWTAEEAAAYLRRRGLEEADVHTVDSAARAMREFLDQRVAWWNGDNH